MTINALKSFPILVQIQNTQFVKYVYKNVAVEAPGIDTTKVRRAQSGYSPAPVLPTCAWLLFITTCNASFNKPYTYS